MSDELQARARAFVQRTVPATVNYVPDSIAERLIGAYARDGHLPDDSETMELIQLAGLESSALAERLSDPAEIEYFRENSAILEGILAENI
jgi:hypothetical protein